MKITGTRVSLISVPLPKPGLSLPRGSYTTWDFVICQVETDEGIVGIGGQDFQNPSWGPSWINHVVTLVDDLLINELREPFYIERFAAVIRSLSSTAPGPRPSCVEMALWDCVGKAAGLPVFKLLGAYKEKAKVYLSSWGEFPNWEPSRWAEFAVQARSEGFRAMKMYCSPQSIDFTGAIERVAKVREAVGDEMEIMMDAESAWSIEPFDLRSALRLADGLYELGVVWLEEPVPHLHNPELSARLASATKMQIAGGGQIFGWPAFHSLLKAGALDVVQPDVGNAGGISEVRKIAVLAEGLGRLCVPHCYGLGLIVAETLHTVCSTNIPYLEYPYFPPVFGLDIRDCILLEPLRISDDGTIAPPGSAGFGVELNQEIIARYTVAEAKSD